MEGRAENEETRKERMRGIKKLIKRMKEHRISMKEIRT